MVNETLVEMFGYPAELLEGQLTSILYSTEADFVSQGQARFELTAEQWLKPADVRYRRADGEEFWGQVVGTVVPDDDGEFLGYLGIISDITERKSAEEVLQDSVASRTAELRTANAKLAAVNEQLHEEIVERRLLELELKRQANQDRLTGLPNRVRLEQAFDRARHQINRGKQIALVFMDLDGFKAINDTHGHLVGDEVLAEISERLQDATRSRDILSRVGGDEFALLLNDATELGASLVADRVQGAITAPLSIDGSHSVTIGVSIGIAFSTEHDHDNTFDELLRRADVAMYDAKKRGGGVSYDMLGSG